MLKKLALITLSAALLGGCTLGNVLKTNNAAVDEKPGSPVASVAPTMSPDTSLESMPKTTTGTDDASLETDVNSTTILDEDFSDIK
jgi:PBP1b-binding outer membrane lipoprotein LpoB